MDIFSWTQILGYLSLCFGLIGFFKKNDVTLKLYMSASTGFRTIHYLMLDSYSACLMAAISTIRTLISLKISSKYMALFFIVLAIVIGFYVTESFMDWLPIISTIISTIALFLFTGIMMRACLMLASIVWLVNNVWVGSIGGMLLETFTVLINISTITRLVIERNKNLPKIN